MSPREEWGVYLRGGPGDGGETRRGKGTMNTQHSCVYLGGRRLYRDAICVAMSGPGLILTAADDVQDALSEARGGSVGGILIDLDDEDARDVSRAAALVAALLKAAPEISVGGISKPCSPELPAALIRAGAGAFLSKDAPLDELRDGVIRMLQGDLVVDPAVARRVFGYLDREAAGAASANTRLPHLTGVEQRVLTLAARGRLNKQIAHELGLSPFTVKNHLARVRQRLDVSTTTEAVVVAMREGLLA